MFARVGSTFDNGKELQKQCAVVAVKLRAPRSTPRLRKQSRNCGWRREYCLENDWLKVEKLVRGLTAMGRK